MTFSFLRLSFFKDEPSLKDQTVDSYLVFACQPSKKIVFQKREHHEMFRLQKIRKTIEFKSSISRKGIGMVNYGKQKQTFCL